MGGAAVAHDFALGGFAQAAQANNEIAAQVIQPNLFFKSGQVVFRHSAWVNLIWVIPLMIWWWLVRIGSRKTPVKRLNSQGKSFMKRLILAVGTVGLLGLVVILATRQKSTGAMHAPEPLQEQNTLTKSTTPTEVVSKRPHA